MRLGRLCDLCALARFHFFKSSTFRKDPWGSPGRHHPAALEHETRWPPPIAFEVKVHYDKTSDQARWRSRKEIQMKALLLTCFASCFLLLAADPTGTIAGNITGRITSAGAPRVIQMALKLNF